MEPVSPDVTSLLRKFADGNQEAAGELIPVVYQELRRLAVRHLRSERPNHTLQPTALVHEAYIKLAAQRNRLKGKPDVHQRQLMREMGVLNSRPRDSFRRRNRELWNTLIIHQKGAPRGTLRLNL